MIKKNSLFLAYFVALVATLSSLYVSEIAGQEACKLCWSQRVFLFPLPILLFFTTFMNRADISAYILPLPICGALAAIHHIGFSLKTCEDCSKISYLPFASLFTFLLIILFLSISLTRRVHFK